MVVLDTSALIYWTLDPDRLSQTAEQAIAEAGRVCISSISIWEIGVMVKKGKLVLPLSVREFAENLERTDRVEILSVDLRTWIGNLELDWDHRDLADRMIVAKAALHACPIVTSNTAIRDFYSQTVW